MSPDSIVAWAAVVVTIISSILVPQYLRKRQAKKEQAQTDLVSWQGITAVLQKERDDLRKRLEDVEADYRRRLSTLEAEYTRQLDEAKGRIRQLEAEVSTLYRRFYGGQANS